MRNWLIGLSVLLVVALYQVIHLTYTVWDKKSQWEQEGITLAKEHTAMEQISEVFLYHGQERYIVVDGESNAGIPMMAWFREDGLLNGFAYKKDLIPLETIQEKVKKQLPEADIVRVQPGMEDRKPLWEIVILDEEGKINYYYYDMKSGDFIRSYRLQTVHG